MNSSAKSTILVIAGPTAVGKTSVAIEVAGKLNTVILSADSRQCFKELDIGVARPTGEELAIVPHYFIASHSIHKKTDAVFYEKYALKLLEELFQQHNTVVVTGGTGLYIKTLLQGVDDIPAIPEDIRSTIIKNYETGGTEWLRQQLHQKDPLFSVKGEMQNPQRMMRALEVVEATGISILNFHRNKKPERNFRAVQVGLEMPRQQLYERINKRVDVMMQQGLEVEAKSLLPYRQLNALQTVGYKEMFDYFDGNISRQQAVELIKQNTRRYAKRQMTWFKKQEEMQWITVAPESDTKTIAQSVLNLL